ncbi:MAG TPA: hypothetical protein VFU21_25310 [Kofleriaceae bacterium]|nr:hypothetical protein [Kofleriaceae bacterium]
MTASHLRLLAFATALPLAAACGGDDDVAGPVDGESGDGTGALLVRAHIDSDEGGAEIEVSVERDGQDVTDAEVVIGTDGADVVLDWDGEEGRYRGFDGEWSGWYSIEVTAGDDWLDGGLEAPDRPTLIAPDPSEAFDPHQAEDGVVVVTWDGDLAMSVRVKTKDFEWSGADEGGLEIPAVMFEDEEQEIEIDRENEIDLAGGAPGSALSVETGAKARLIVLNPYND